MITCAKCEHSNPLGSIFCHGCGARLDVQMADVIASVHGTKTAQQHHDIYAWGRSAFSLCSFALVCSLLLRYVLVPPVPIAEFPTAPTLPLIGKEQPTWAKATTATGPTVELAKPTATIGRLQWRQQQGGFILGSLGLDLDRIQAWQKALIDTQKADGSFPGADPIAATSLAALALQAYSVKDTVVVAGGKARAYLLQGVSTLAQKSSLTRTLGAMALIESEQLDGGVRATFGPLLVDGNAAVWQALNLLSFAPAERPNELSALTLKLKDPLWTYYFALVAHKPMAFDPKLLSAENAKTLTSGEDRLLWALLAWHLPYAPKDLAETLRAWTAAEPAPVDVALTKQCGPSAAIAVAVLTVTAPIRVPALTLQPAGP